MKQDPFSRRFQKSVRIGAFVLVAVSGIALYLTEKLPVSSLLLIGTTPLGWLFGKERSHSRFWEIASFLYLFFFFYDALRISQSLAPALVHLFIFILINKMFNLQTDRDYFQLYLLTFLTILAASSLYVEIQMFYLLIVYILLLVWNVISLTLLREWKKGDDGTAPPFFFFHPMYALMIVVTISITFAIAMGIFFIVPRMQLGYLAGLKTGEQQHVSGFSQKVELGDIAKIQQDSGEAMRVRVSSKVPVGAEHFYWRGIAFDHYDGKAWSNSLPGTRFLFQDSTGIYHNLNYSDSPDLLVKQEFYLAPLDTRVVFGQDRIVMIQGDFNAITRDNNGTLEGMAKPSKYEVYSRVVSFRPEWLRARKINASENVKRYFTQLPDRSSRIDQLAKNITAGANTVYDRAQKIQTYLNTNYTYTTTDLPRDDKDPISEFLFQKKAGHCEYFATSMVVLLRHLGIASRVVNGFLEGEYNAIGDFYVIRQTDAHSWVEVYFGEGLWVTFDPSPRLLNAGEGGTSLWSKLATTFRKVRESISFFWDRYILIFSAQDQLNAISTIREQYDAMREKARQSTGHQVGSWKHRLREIWKRHGFSIGMIFSVLAMSVYMIRLMVTRRRQLKVSRTPVLFYQEMLAILQRKGYSRSPEITPAEFLETVGPSLPERYVSDLSSLTDLFYKARFGNHAVTAEEQVAVRDALNRLEQMK